MRIVLFFISNLQFVYLILIILAMFWCIYLLQLNYISCSIKVNTVFLFSIFFFPFGIYYTKRNNVLTLNYEVIEWPKIFGKEFIIKKVTNERFIIVIWNFYSNFSKFKKICSLNLVEGINGKIGLFINEKFSLSAIPCFVLTKIIYFSLLASKRVILLYNLTVCINDDNWVIKVT